MINNDYVTIINLKHCWTSSVGWSQFAANNESGTKISSKFLDEITYWSYVNNHDTRYNIWKCENELFKYESNTKLISIFYNVKWLQIIMQNI